MPEVSAPLRATRVGARVLVLTRGGESLAESFGANAVVVRGERSFLLVDPLVAPAEAAAVESAARAFAGKDLPLEAVVLTHHHTDHALGAGLFRRRGVRVLASAPCVRLMARHHPGLVAARRADPALAALFADAEPYAPEEVPSAFEIDLGGVTALVRAVGPAHTAGDLVVEIPGEKLLIAGDLVSNGYHVNYEEADVAGYEAALRALASRTFAHVVPGHGAPGGAELLREALAKHARCREIVERGGSEGLGEEAVAARLAEAFPGHLLDGVLADAVRRLRGRPTAAG